MWLNGDRQYLLFAIFWLLIASLQYLQGISNEDSGALHYAMDCKINVYVY